MIIHITYICKDIFCVGMKKTFLLIFLMLIIFCTLHVEKNYLHTHASFSYLIASLYVSC